MLANGSMSSGQSGEDVNRRAMVEAGAVDRTRRELSDVDIAPESSTPTMRGVAWRGVASRRRGPYAIVAGTAVELGFDL